MSLSPPVFLLISTHFTATLGIPHTPAALKPTSFGSSPAVKPRNYAANLANHLRTLYAQSFRITLAPTYYRGCWHVVSRCLFCGYSHFLRPRLKSFTIRKLLHSRGVAGSELPIAQYSPLLPPVGVFGPCLSSNVADHPLRSATHSSAWWAVTSPTT